MNRFFNATLLLIAVIGLSNLSSVACHAQSSELDKSIEDKFRKYVGQLILRYDKNDDGMLDEDEAAEFQRPPSGADSNDDGLISEDELVKHYVEYFRRDGVAIRSRKRTGSDKDKVDQRKKKRRYGLLGNASPEAVSALLDGGVASAPAALSVDVFMLRANSDSPLEKLATNIRGKSSKDVEQMLNAIRRDEAFVCDYDTMQFSANWNEEFRMRVASEVPVVEGMSSQRGGEVTTSISNVSVGTRLIMTASNKNDGQVLNIDFDKSSVFDSETVLYESKSGEKTYAKTIGNVEYDGELAFEMNKATVVSMSESGSTWVLIVIAK